MIKTDLPESELDGFRELARLTWHGAAASSNPPASPSFPTLELINVLAELLRAASRGQGMIPLSDPRTQGLSASHFREHPLFFAIDGPWLLLPRYAAHLRAVRAFFEDRLQNPQQSPPHNHESICAALNAILPARQILNDHGISVFDNIHQRIAIAGLIHARAGILTGGPGTGKTTTAAALLAIHKRLNPSMEAASVLVTAPTGKAACRIAEAIARASKQLENLTQEERLFLRSIRSLTIHSALQWSRINPERGGPFRRNDTNPLEAKIVLVDEASMVDLSLMASLTAAIDRNTTLLLLGDSNQLKSVEVEGVLCELVERGASADLPPNTLHAISSRTNLDLESVSKSFRDALPSPNATDISQTALPGIAFGLKYSHRAKHAPWVLELADLFRPGTQRTLDELTALLDQTHDSNLLWHARKRSRSNDSACSPFWKSWAEHAKDWIRFSPDSPTESLLNPLSLLAKFQLLCSTNAQVDQANADAANFLWPDRKRHPHAIPHGCPILVHANNHALDLSNGDVGIALGTAFGEPASLGLFPSGSSIPRLIPLAQLPAHGPAFALTIHKSQGSEWEHVVIELPHGSESSMLSKNLLYTGITRSSRRIELFGDAKVIEQILNRP